MVAKLGKNSAAGTTAARTPTDVEALLKQVVARAQHSPRSTAHPNEHTDDGAGEVLVDYEVDGVRCVLARTSHAPATRLSPRELDVARMVAKGYPNKIIASVLEISVWTVSTHLRRIFAKLGVTSRAAMVTTIVKRGQL